MCVETAWHVGQAASHAVASALIVSTLSEVSTALIRNPGSSKGMQFKVLQLVKKTRGILVDNTADFTASRLAFPPFCTKADGEPTIGANPFDLAICRMKHLDP